MDYINNTLDTIISSATYPDISDVDRSSVEVRHIGFLKVHKAGSTTIQNMLFRFGLKRNLSFVIPRSGNHFSVSSTLPVKQAGHYDILAIHTTFNKRQFDQMLPLDKVNIGIVREPLDRMISAAYYYRGLKHLRAIPEHHYIQELVNDPEKYDREDFSVTKNAMGRDFGFEANTREYDIDKILKKLIFLDKEFELVLVLERFDESLVLLKRYLGWQIADIVYIPSNTRSYPETYLTEEQKLKHKHTCFLDYAIYDFFSKIFNYKVKAEGPGFQDEVKYFRDVIQQTKAFCAQPTTDANKLNVKASKWNSKFRVSRSDCKVMLLREKKFIERLRIRHIKTNSVKDLGFGAILKGIFRDYMF